MAEQMSLDEMLAACEGSCQESFDAAREEWTPPFSTYTVVAKEPRFFSWTDKESGTSKMAIALVMEILDGDHKGKTWEFNIHTNVFSLGTAKSLAALIGCPAPNFGQLCRNLSESLPGKVLVVKYGERHDKKNPNKTYEEIKFLELVKG